MFFVKKNRNSEVIEFNFDSPKYCREQIKRNNDWLLWALLASSWIIQNVPLYVSESKADDEDLSDGFQKNILLN